MEVVTRRFVRPEHTNHHHSLYAGYISEWLTEASFIAMAKTLGTTEGYVLAAIKEIQVQKSVYPGDVLEFCYCPKNIGTTSVELLIEGRGYLSQEKHCQGTVVYVTVDEAGKKTPHGLPALSAERNEGK